MPASTQHVMFIMPPVIDHLVKSAKPGMFNFDNIWKVAVLVFLLASLYLQHNFVTRPEFEKSQGDIHTLQIDLVHIQDENESYLQDKMHFVKIDETLEKMSGHLGTMDQSLAVLMDEHVKNSDKYLTRQRSNP